MSERVRRRGRTPEPTWWQKHRKWVVRGGIGAGAVVALVLVVMFILSLFKTSPAQQDQVRERLTAAGFSNGLTESNTGMSGFVWMPPKDKDNMVIFQNVNIEMSGGTCKSVTAEVHASADGRNSPKRKELCSLSYSPGSGVAVKETKSGAPQPLVDRARREFEQLTTALSQK